jgi:threonyl-tRNA synthetase
MVLLSSCRELIRAANEPYKLEILESIKTEPITIYGMEARPGSAASAAPHGFQWWDLCAGPHLASTGELNTKAVQLQSVAGAYWRGDEKQAMLQVSAAAHAVFPHRNFSP